MSADLPKILVVEDEPGIAENICYALGTEGFAPRHAATLGAGWEELRRGGVALVILDLGLPDGSGLDFCREVRRESGVPIIIVTARENEIDRVVGLELGADDYVVKPFSPRELGFRVFVRVITDEVEPRYRESMEESLVDTAEILAGLLSLDAEGRIDAGVLEKTYARLGTRELDATIYDLKKTEVDLRIYVTDAKGIVVYHSHSPEEVGADYSRWNDVYLTLRGEYGVRSSDDELRNTETSVLHVAAPILVDGQLRGVLTVAKPAYNVDAFIAKAKRQLAWTAIVAGVVIVVGGLAVTFWITAPLERLTRYARAVAERRRVEFPKLGSAGEIRELGAAFERMRESLEGKKYVEQYVQTLAHEMKSPLSAIHGAAELLNEEIPTEQRGRFVANIRGESARLLRLVQQALLLSSIESRDRADRVGRHKLAEILAEAREMVRFEAGQRGITVRVGDAGGVEVRCERPLIVQAVGNLLQNAIDFSADGAEVDVVVADTAEAIVVTVRDCGGGIPDYAEERLYERFYSLPRPNGGAKSSGLGLSLVREIAELHGGTIRLANRVGGGVEAELRIPRDFGAGVRQLPDGDRRSQIRNSGKGEFR